MKSALLSNEKIEDLSEAIAEIDGVIGAYLFGSYAAGNACGRSDVDLGILYEKRDKVELAYDVLAVAQDILKTDDVDLCLLNSASPLMAFEVISGKRIVTNDIAAVAEFESVTSREYEDESARIEHCRLMGGMEAGVGTGAA